MSGWDEEADLVIVGSGGGSLVAAIAAADAGRKPLVLEKTDKVGGSTSMSGGVLWVPDNPVGRRAGVKDSQDQARAYLDALVGDVGPSTSPARKDMFLRMGPQMVDYLERKGL
jgi:3-oxosteroid 1-dehydrogenase